MKTIYINKRAFVIAAGVVMALLAIGIVLIATHRPPEYAYIKEIEQAGAAVAVDYVSGPTPYSGGGKVYLVSFSGVPLTDRQFEKLVPSLTGLPIKSLNLGGTLMTDDSITSFTRIGSSLTYAHIDLTGTKITKGGIRQLENSLPYAKIVDYASPNTYRHLECADLLFSPDGSLIVIVEPNETRVYDLQSTKQSAQLPGGRIATFSPSGRRLAVAEVDRCWVWDVGSPAPAIFIAVDYVQALAFAPDEKSLYVYQNRITYRFAMDGGRVLSTSPSLVVGGSQEVQGVDLPLALTDVFHPERGQSKGQFPMVPMDGKAELAPPAQSGMAVISSDASRCAWTANQATNGLADGSIMIADLPRRTVIMKLQLPSGFYASSGMFDTSSQRLAVGASNGTESLVRVIDLTTNTPLFGHRERAGFVHQVALSADGKQVAAATENQMVQWWPVK